jgi:hypothetical protein
MSDLKVYVFFLLVSGLLYNAAIIDFGALTARPRPYSPN